MGQALYRKHRPKSLKQVIGQEHITHTLAQALKQGRISHAYLFTGPRGVGKTSVARIWAHEINGLAYTDDSMHMDIIEIDAASNRRIDEIRDLRDKVYIAPTSARYKVYIIDEVHMLTKEAFNALLKTLEEPPEHAVFILATTDAHKLPATIISRTQRYNFKPGEPTKVINYLQNLAKDEKITIDRQALTLIAEHGEGSFRDSVSLLDQASSHGKPVTLADVQQLLGVPSVEAMQSLLNATLSGAAPAQLMSQITALYNQGFQAAAIAKQLGQLMRQGLIDSTIDNYENTVQLLGRLIEVPSSHNPERFLEITLLQSQSLPQPTQVKTVDAAEPPPIFQELPEADQEIEEPHQTMVVETVIAPPAEAGTAKVDDDLWPKILQALKQKHNTLYGIVRMAEPNFSEEGLTLAFAFPFHQKRSNEASNRQRLSDIIKLLTGKAIVITCVVNSDAIPPKVTVAPLKKVASADISAISNIFGGAELLES